MRKESNFNLLHMWFSYLSTICCTDYSFSIEWCWCHCQISIEHIGEGLFLDSEFCPLIYFSYAVSHFFFFPHTLDYWSFLVSSEFMTCESCLFFSFSTLLSFLFTCSCIWIYDSAFPFLQREIWNFHRVHWICTLVWGVFKLFPPFILQIVLLWTWVYKYLFEFLSVYRSGIAGSYGDFLFTFLRWCFQFLLYICLVTQ